MRAIDTNVLVHYHREEMPKHAEAVELIRELSEGSTLWSIPIFCISEFLRVVTHRRIFDPPAPLDLAIASVEAILESYSVRLLLPGERFWSLFRQTSLQARTTGNLVFDAQIAALCLEHGVETLITEDRDFMRFEGLAVIPI